MIRCRLPAAETALASPFTARPSLALLPRNDAAVVDEATRSGEDEAKLPGDSGFVASSTTSVIDFLFPGLHGRWDDAGKRCREILAIAPKHRLALETQRRSEQVGRRKTTAGLRVTNMPPLTFERPCEAPPSTPVVGGTVTEPSPSGNRPSTHDTVYGQQQTETVITGPQNDPDGNLLTPTRFMLWVDGVGGFLVCAQSINSIGQWTADATVAIPLVGDLRRRHARIEFVGGSHLLEPLGPVTTDGQPQPRAWALRDQQVIEFEGGVKLKYLQSHPLSKSARLEFVSRHRTRPWSDAVILAAQSIILGPNRANHIYCPTWPADLIIFRRQQQWFCRATTELRVDGQIVSGPAKIQLNSAIASDDFSVTLEPI